MCGGAWDVWYVKVGVCRRGVGVVWCRAGLGGWARAGRAEEGGLPLECFPTARSQAWSWDRRAELSHPRKRIRISGGLVTRRSRPNPRHPRASVQWV